MTTGPTEKTTTTATALSIDDDSEAELLALLGRAEMTDLERLTEVLDRWPRPARLAERMSLARSSTDKGARKILEETIARALLRDATGEISHAARRVMSGVRGRSTGSAPKADLHGAVTRSAKRLGVRVPAAGTLAGRAGALTKSFVDRTLLTMSPEEQHRLVADGLDRTTGLLPGAPRVAQAAALPALHAAIGTTALVKVAEAIVAQMTAALLGREIARAAMRAVMSRAPIVTAALGPAAWAVSGAMLVWEIQRPADRKVIPAMLCLGLIAVR